MCLRSMPSSSLRPLRLNYATATQPWAQGSKKTALNHVTRITLPTRIGRAQAQAAAQARALLGQGPPSPAAAGTPTSNPEPGPSPRPAAPLAAPAGIAAGTSDPALAGTGTAGAGAAGPAAAGAAAMAPVTTPQPEATPPSLLSVVLRVNGAVLPFLCPASLHTTQVLSRGPGSPVFQLSGMQVRG